MVRFPEQNQSHWFSGNNGFMISIFPGWGLIPINPLLLDHRKWNGYNLSLFPQVFHPSAEAYSCLAIPR
jgi:hypothetical protein